MHTIRLYTATVSVYQYRSYKLHKK